MKKYQVTSKEADLYLDNTYSSQIYKSAEEFITMQNKFKEIIMQKGISGDDDYNIMLYKNSRTEYESNKLFDIAVEETGRSLWTEEAWHNPDCHKICPLCNICDKKLISINNNEFCYGQIYMNIPYELPKQQKYEILSEMYYFAIMEFINCCNIENECTL
ncbi:MAG: hypothetical protein NC247_05750 [Ruminococcus flavefaciens]|nr:hypothetical protein [Ruminococcus flavefaciens]MCM1361801.1 hypothetical protein [Clostridiales bacterium]MCM1435650.1 hypothetical protein [Ruminococcus flavefaciens]